MIHTLSAADITDPGDFLVGICEERGVPFRYYYNRRDQQLERRRPVFREESKLVTPVDGPGLYETTVGTSVVIVTGTKADYAAAGVLELSESEAAALEEAGRLSEHPDAGIGRGVDWLAGVMWRARETARGKE